MARLNDTIDYKPKMFFFNENIFPAELFDFIEFPLKKFSFKCIPALKRIKGNYSKFFQKQFFDNTIIDQIIENNNKHEFNGSIINFKHFYESQWYLYIY